MDSKIQVFDFQSQEIRFIEGKPVANDIAKVLGYSDVKSTICKKVSSINKGVAKMATPGGVQSVTVLEEAGIYQLIFSSKLPSAEKFQQWVFEEVLPSIRKTGKYEINKQPELPQTYLEALKALVASEEEKLKLESKNKALTVQIIEDKPKVEFAEAVKASDTSLSFNEYSKLINWGRNRLMTKLRSLNVLMKNTTLPYQRYIDAGYFEVSQEVTQSGKLIPFALITGKGQLWLSQKINAEKQLENDMVFALFKDIMS